MNAEQIIIYLRGFLPPIILCEVGVIILLVGGFNPMDTIRPSPEVIHYLKNCDNLTLYPQGCRVLV